MLSAVAAPSDSATPASPPAGTADASAASVFADTLAAHKLDQDRADTLAKAKTALASKDAKDTKALAQKSASPKIIDPAKTGDDDNAATIVVAKTASKKDAAAAVATAKAESAATLAASLLNAIGAGAASVAVTATGADAKLKADDTELTAVGAKAKAKAIAAAKRDGAAEPKAKAEATIDHDGAKTAKAAPAGNSAAPPPDAKTAIVAKAADAAPLPSSSAPTSATDTLPAASPPAASTVELRIPLAREAAAQAGAAAPIVAMRVHTKDGVTKAIELRLDPQGLGPVSVKLETDAQGRLRAVVQADKSEAFELLKRDGSTLEAALRDAGVNLGDEGVSFSLNDGGQAGADSGQRNAAYDGAVTRRDA